MKFRDTLRIADRLLILIGLILVFVLLQEARNSRSRPVAVAPFLLTPDNSQPTVTTFQRGSVADPSIAGAEVAGENVVREHVIGYRSTLITRTTVAKSQFQPAVYSSEGTVEFVDAVGRQVRSPVPWKVMLHYDGAAHLWVPDSIVGKRHD